MEFTSAATWGTLYYASEWVIRLVMLVVVPRRRSPEAAKSWLLFVFFLPWPGLVLYHLIGRPNYPRWRVERFKRLPEAFRPVLKRLHGSLRQLRPHLPAELAPAAVLVQNLGHLATLGGNDVELLADYDAAIDRLVADIDQATDHVHLLYYIFADDSRGSKVIEALARAVQRGVDCRALVDQLGSRPWTRSLLPRLAAAGIAVREALPVNLLRRSKGRADLRNHRKIAVIDARIGYTGSQNLVAADFKPHIVNEELVARVRGPVVLQLQSLFVTDWFMESGDMLADAEVFPEPSAAGGVVAQVLPSGPDYPTTNVNHLVVALIHAARERVVLTTPYFIPNDVFIQALDTAVRRGVQVHLVVSGVADQVLVSLAQRSYYSELLRAGVHIHLYRDKLLHAKHVSIDGAISLIGSSNMDIRSFVLNAEVTLVLYDADVTARLKAVQERYFAGSDLVSAEEWARRKLSRKLAENLARLMSPLL